MGTNLGQGNSQLQEVDKEYQNLMANKSKLPGWCPDCGSFWDLTWSCGCEICGHWGVFTLADVDRELASIPAHAAEFYELSAVRHELASGRTNSR